MTALLKRLTLAAALLLMGLPLLLTYQVHPLAMPCLLAAEVVLAMGGWVRKQDARNPLHRAFFDVCLAIFCYLFTVYLLHIATITGVEPLEYAVRISRVGHLAGPAALIRFVILFTGLRAGWSKILQTAAYLATLSLLALNALGLFVQDYKRLELTYVPSGDLTYYRIFALFLIGSFLFAIVVVLLRALQPSQRARRASYLLFLGGLGLSTTYSLLGFLPLLRKDYFPSPIGIGWIAFPACIALAILRYNLFDIKVMIRRTLPYALGSAAIGCLYALSHITLDYGLSGMLQSDRFASALILFVLTGLCFQPIMEWLQKALDVALFRQEAQMERLLIETGRRWSECLSPEHLFHTALADINAMLHPERALLVSGVERQENAISLPPLPAANQPQAFPFERLFLADQACAEWGMWIKGDDSLAKDIQANRLPPSGLLLPFFGKRVRGAILLGEKKSHLAYTAKEISILTALVRQMATALARIEADSQAHSAREFTDLLLQSMDVAVAQLSASGDVLRINAAFRASFGEIRTIDGLGWKREREASSRTTEIHHNDRVYLASSQPMASSAGTAETLLLLSDITELHRLRQREQRQAALAEIGTAVSAINHEIQNILSPIRFFIDKATTTATEADAQEALQALRQRFQTLEALTRELREYYKAPQLHPMRIPLQALASSAVDDVASMCKRMSDGSGWSPPRIDVPPETILADPQRVKRVLVNLLKNAWEAMEGKTGKDWSIAARKEPAGSWHIVIRDTGKGIAEGVQKKLFQPFFSQKKDTGTGLGLAICRRIMEAHGGTIQLSSREGHGTEATLTFPPETSTGEHAPAADGTDRHAAPLDAMDKPRL